jgi:hypothetical protein
MISLFNEPVYWVISHDMNPIAQKLADRHYSRENPGSRKGFIGPGEKIVLLSSDGKALFAWCRQNPELRLDHIDGVNCTIFRNESSVLSSKLILEAEKFAHDRWPGLKLFTYVSKAKVKSKNPGWCFMKAGWKPTGENKSGELRLLIKEALK